MNSKAKGTERQFPYSSAAVGGASRAHEAGAPEAELPVAHAPEGEALLKRFLSEVHSYRTIGNVALQELESRLTALSCSQEQQQKAEPCDRDAAADAAIMPPPPPAGQEADGQSQSLSERLRELTSYLHADLSKAEVAPSLPPKRFSNARPAPAPRGLSDRGQLAPAPAVEQRQPPQQHKVPTAPVLDRLWFEERFAALRTSISELAEKVPAKRMDALEGQFHQLMERLEAREAARGGMGAVEAGLKKLAAYLEDSKQWANVHDQRVRNVEERLEHLSGLVAQSHAAISATAKGLEIVARGTGSNLARQTAELVASHVEERIAQLDPGRPLAELSREVANLSMQSRQYARATDERLNELHACLNGRMARRESAAPEQAPAQMLVGRDQTSIAAQMPVGRDQTSIAAQMPVGRDQTSISAQMRVQPPAPAQTEGARKAAAPSTESIENYLASLPLDDTEDYDRELIAAAQRAARLAEGPQRDLPAHGEPVRYQIPYGEFLPDEERRNSHIGLVVAAVILLLASAAMLYLNLREKDAFGLQPSVTSPTETEQPKPSRARVSQAVPHSQPAKSAEAAQGTPAGVVLSDDNVVRLPQSSAVKEKAKTGALTSTETITPAGASKTQGPVSTAAIEKSSVSEAAVKGEPNAQFTVGQSYLTGQDAEHQLDANERMSMAVRWFRRAAENGHAASQYRLATLYELGQGAPKDLREAEVWYQRAAEAGHVKAMHNLAVLSVGEHTGTANYLTAAKWFTKAAEYGLADSQYNLGILYERGLGVSPNLAKAYQWFALAARQGDAKAIQRRDAIARMLPADEKALADAAITGWSRLNPDPQVNGVAPEPPAEQTARAAVKPEASRTQLMKTAWTTEVTAQKPIVLDAQRLLGRLGYNPGPVDGIIGPRTIAAVRQFETQQGHVPTGRITGALVARLAFLQQ